MNSKDEKEKETIEGGKKWGVGKQKTSQDKTS